MTKPFEIDEKTGWLRGVHYLSSPYFSKRKPSEIDLLVIHNISLPPGQFGGMDIDNLFRGQLDGQAYPDLVGLKVSAHMVIRRDGKITQYVSFYHTAWHAGISSFEGRADCNDYSIGIELEGTDNLPYEAVQYEQLVKISCGLMQRFPKMTLERIVGHSQVAPGRKTDPGETFDWAAFKKQLQLLYNRISMKQ